MRHSVTLALMTIVLVAGVVPEKGPAPTRQLVNNLTIDASPTNPIVAEPGSQVILLAGNTACNPRVTVCEE